MLLSARRRKTSLDTYIGYGLALSLLVHILLALLFARREQPQTIEPFIVDIIPEQSAPTRPLQEELPKQIVSEPQSQESEKPLPETRLLAEKSRVAEREQIKRGDRPDAGPKATQSSQARSASKQISQKPAQRPSDQPQNTTLRHLTLDNRELLESFANSAPASSSSASPIKSAFPAPFSRPSGSGAAFFGRSGNSDFLPQLPDGDITLLNTKADQFAVFVRRVASLVFGQLRASGWDALSSRDINAISNFTTVRASMSADGKLIRVQLLESSGSSRFDSTLVEASKIGARDPNPPAGALAADGNIHFIFRSKSWSRWGAASRNGAPVERRWLLLATGLE